jgi:dTDP-4-amino-4,6-dideoxy-D-galactose acyltransferase
MTPADASVCCQFLEWDSGHFGRRIGRVKSNRLTAELMQEVEQWCCAQRIDCLYFLAAPNERETSRLVLEHGFQLVDIRITLRLRLAARSAATAEPAVPEIRLARPKDLPALRQMVARLHDDSRFFLDPRFGRALSERMFEIWIEKSCADKSGRVFVSERQGKPAGYVACRRLSDETGQIDLIGVDDRAQGQGIGRKLVSAALRWFSAEQIEWVNVVTQGRNYAAQRLYQRSGFLTQSIELWYHRWFGELKNLPHE